MLIPKYKLILSLIFLASLLLGRNSLYSIAVLDFVPQGVTPELAGTLTDHFAVELNNTNTMRMVNRNRMSRIFNDKGFEQTGCDSIDCAVIAGYMLGVEQMIVGSIWKLDTTYTIDVHIISVQYGKTLRSNRITYEGEMDGLIEQMKLLAWNLIGMEPPERLAKKERIREYTLMIEEEKTKGGALFRSLLLPGFGQFYSGKKVSAFSYVSAELAFIVMAMSRQSNFLSLQSDQESIRTLYDASTVQEDINNYSAQLISLNNKIKNANSQLMLYTASAAGIWALNVIHALVLDPSFDARAKKTQGSALARSLLMPGFGQLYTGRKTAGYTFIGLELAFIGLTVNSYSNSRSLKADQEKIQASYLAATTQEDISAYSEQLVDLDKKIKAANNLTSLFTVSAIAVWGLNVAHAFIMGTGDDNDVTTVPLTLAYDPLSKQTQIQWTVHF